MSLFIEVTGKGYWKEPCVIFFFPKINSSANLQLTQLQVTVVTNNSALHKYCKNYLVCSEYFVTILIRNVKTLQYLSSPITPTHLWKKALSWKNKTEPPQLLPSHKLRLFLSFIQLILRLGLLSWQYDQKSRWEKEWFPQSKYPQTSQLLFVHLTFSGKGNTGNIQVKWGCLTSGLGSCKCH